MRTVLDCLSQFAVSAAFNSPNALEEARAAIDEYLVREKADDPLRRIQALSDLRDRFLDLRLDSANAQAILGEIEARMFDVLAVSMSPSGGP